MLIYHSYGNSSAFSTLTLTSDNSALYCHPPPTEPTRTPDSIQEQYTTITTTLFNIIHFIDSSIAIRVRIYIYGVLAQPQPYITE